MSLHPSTIKYMAIAPVVTNLPKNSDLNPSIEEQLGKYVVATN